MRPDPPVDESSSRQGVRVASAFEPGVVVSTRYVVDEFLGEGATARTYLATDTLRGGQTVLKVLSDRQLSPALRHEFTVLRGLVHPSLNPPRGFGVDASFEPRVEYLVSDFVSGVTLDRFAVGKTWGELRQVLLDVLRGLRFLHSRGLGHGDVKPSNVMVNARGRGVLIDFGCARRLGVQSDEFYGTLAFAAPELKRGGAFDARSDLYALGKTLESLLPSLSEAPPPAERELLSTLTAPVVSARPSEVSQALEALGVHDASPSAGSGEAPEFLGRGQELEQLARVLSAVHSRSDDVRWVNIWGLAGVGVSRLLEEAKFRAQLHGDVLEAVSSRRDAIAELAVRVAGAGAKGSAGSVAAGGMVVDEAAPSFERVLTAWRERAHRGDPMVVIIDDTHHLQPKQLELLKALARTTEPADRMLCLSASRAPLGIESTALLEMELGPLDRSSVAAWYRAASTELTEAQLFSQSRGFPGAIRQLLANVGTRHDLAALDAHELSALALLVAGARELAAPLASAETWAALSSRGWVRRTADGIELLHDAQRDALRAQLPEPKMVEAHARICERLRSAVDGSQAGGASASLSARLARHELARGEVAAALSLVVGAQPNADWLPFAEELARSRDDGVNFVALSLFAGRVLLASGEYVHLRQLLGRGFSRASTRARVELAELGVELSLRTAKLERARRLASRCLTWRQALELETLPALLLLARTELQLGQYERASDRCAAGLRLTATPEQLAELRQVQAMASTYLGQTRQAVELLRPLADEFRQLGQRREESRCYSYLAITHFRQGDLGAARDAYDHAFEAAEANGDSDLIASALLNRATLDQQLGHWGAALRGYERAMMLARALGRNTTVLSLRYNLGNLYQLIGAFDHAQRLLEGVLAAAQGSSTRPMECSALIALAELASNRGQATVACDYAARAVDLTMQLGAAREKTEARLLSAWVAAEHGRADDAKLALENQSCSDVEESDLRSTCCMLKARLCLIDADVDGALKHARAALQHAESATNPALTAKAHTLLFQVLNTAHDASALTHRDSAWRAYNRIASELPESYREAFWGHPERLPLLAPNVASARGEVGGERTLQRGRLQQFLSLNRRINSTLSIDQVLGAALDAAIELTGAERGFVLMATAEDEVAPRAMRNISRGGLEGESMDFSRTIAERVLRTERAVVTVDAMSDARFALQASVHAMQLKSVCCVPFVSANGARGVLYVDNRLQGGRFHDEDSDLLVALGDQVAIALDNAQLHADLMKRREELEEAKRALEKHVAAQKRRISGLERTLETQQMSISNRYAYERIVGRGPAMQRVLSVLDRVIDTDVTVLIGGESGTGKELVARAIHANSGRKQGAFVSVNCGALPDTLIESELFGHRKGAFSGATQDRRGLLQVADGGTVFLDEIGELPLASQVKLLRALQERSVRPLGAANEESIDVRVVAATNRDLAEEVAKGRFREDLFFRLSVVQVEVPALRERLEDVPELCQALLQRIAEQHGVKTPTLSKAALGRLLGYSWPGNVRQLENVLTKAALLCEGVISPEHLALETRPAKKLSARSRKQFESEEAERIFAALRSHGWNVSAVARSIDMPRNTLYRRMKRYKLSRDDDA